MRAGVKLNARDDLNQKGLRAANGTSLVKLRFGLIYGTREYIVTNVTFIPLLPLHRTLTRNEQQQSF